MPSVSARRKTREFGVVKGADGARVLRSGRRVLTEAGEGKLKGAYGGNECLPAKAKNSLKNHGNKENGWANGAKLKKQESPQIRNIVVPKKVPKRAPKSEPEREPSKAKNESVDGSGERKKRFGIVYSRKRKRAVGVERSETLEGKRYRLHFTRRQRRNESLVSSGERSAPELSVVVQGGSCTSRISGGFACLFYLVLKYIKRARLEVSALAAFLVSEPFSSVFASHGIRFLKAPPSDRTGICKFFASEQHVPMFSVDFSALPLCFTYMHNTLSFRFRCLSLEPVNNCLDDDEWDEMMSNGETDDSCIPVVSELTNAGTVVPEVDNSRSTVVQHPSVRASKLAVRNTQHKNGLHSRGIRKRRSSSRGRKARNTSLVGVHKTEGALISDLVSSRKKGIPFSSVVSKNKLRSPVRGRSASNLERVRTTVLAVSRSMELSKDKLRSSARHSYTTNIKEVVPTAVVGVAREADMSRCSANVLVIELDRCYRIKEATIMLETSDSGECRLVVKKDGSAKFTHLAQKVMKPCSSNRVTHDILWTVDENLKLEFPNRQDWLIFKDLYKECYDRNVPSSTSKAIPVPGVCEVLGYEHIFSAPFSRPNAYICVNNDELDRALSNRTANYDMDCEDEEWLKNLNDRFIAEADRLSEEKFELIIDSFERAFHCSFGEIFDENAVINQCTEWARKDVVDVVYNYWMKKRKQRRGPLIRVFQAHRAKKAPLILKPVLRKRRSFNRQPSHCGRGKQTSTLLAMAAEHDALVEEQNALLKVEAAKAAAKKAVELAIAKRRRAQSLMENADLAVYRALMALEIAETAQRSADAAVPPMIEEHKDS